MSLPKPIAVLVAVAGASLALACGGGPIQECKDSVTATCGHAFACATADQKASSRFMAEFGVSEAECNTRLLPGACGDVDDSGKCTPPGAAVGSGTWNATAAALCVADIKAETCEQFSSGTFSSANCAIVCQKK